MGPASLGAFNWQYHRKVQIIDALSPVENRLARGGWSIVPAAAPLSSLSKETDVLRWQDTETPLSIWQSDAGGQSSYSLRMSDELRVDILPGQQIIVRPRGDLPQFTIDHFLADQVLPRLLAHEGALVIHAGAVRVGDQAVLLMGQSGRGKSTLTASFDQAGIPLIGDDAMIIVSDNDGPSVRPVYPSLRLLPDSIDALIPGAVTAGPIAHYSTKHRIDVAGDRDVDAPALPIGALFSIGLAAAEIAIRPIAAATACMALVANSFALDPSDMVQARGRLQAASALVARVPAFEIEYPRDYSRLDEVRRAILDQLAALDRE